MKYIAQHDRFRCGPIAILNALRWAGKDVSYKANITYISNICECEPPNGTSIGPFTVALREASNQYFKSTLIMNPTLSFIENSLRDEKALLWNYKHGTGRHYALIVDVNTSGKTFKVVNFWQGTPALVNVSRNVMKRVIRQRDDYHRVWVLSKVVQ